MQCLTWPSHWGNICSLGGVVGTVLISGEINPSSPICRDRLGREKDKSGHSRSGSVDVGYHKVHSDALFCL